MVKKNGFHFIEYYNNTNLEISEESLIVNTYRDSPFWYFTNMIFQRNFESRFNIKYIVYAQIRAELKSIPPYPSEHWRSILASSTPRAPARVASASILLRKRERRPPTTTTTTTWSPTWMSRQVVSYQPGCWHRVCGASDASSLCIASWCTFCSRCWSRSPSTSCSFATSSLARHLTARSVAFFRYRRSWIWITRAHVRVSLYRQWVCTRRIFANALWHSLREHYVKLIFYNTNQSYLISTTIVSNCKWRFCLFSNVDRVISDRRFQWNKIPTI